MSLAALLMPGMDGTGRLFGPLIHALPPDLAPRVVSYPPDRVLGYRDLEPLVPLPEGPFVIVAESFSGPLAIRIAARSPPGLRALILVASFARRPWPRLSPWLRPLILPALFAVPPHPTMIRAALVGPDAPAPLVAGVMAAIRAVRPEVLAHRLREILSIDASRELQELKVPILAITGRRDALRRAWAEDTLQHLRRDISAVVLDAPHLVLQRRPREAANAIADFVRRGVT